MNNLSPDQFLIMKTIGMGKFSHVNLCYHKPTDRFVAMKVISKRLIITLNQVAHVKSERTILGEVKHPNIAELFGSFQDENYLYIISEYVAGGEVFTHLRSMQCFDPEAVRFYAAEIFMVLEELHKKGIIYRDLKPENLLLDADGHIRFVDFGFAKHIDDRTYTMCGTPEYLAPEIITGDGTSKASDWWSFGIIIYEMLTGETPFAGYDEDEMYTRICYGVSEYSPMIDETTKDLLQGLLMVDPQQRLGSGLEGSEEIKKHPYFEGIDWTLMRNHLYQTPMVPMVTSPYDTENFADFSSYIQQYEPLTEEMKKITFAEF